ncbi:MAG TPA: roadblock/LC7 domain-containing protein [Candidatus Sulfotelmatobacter sp.]|jgi:predicted regulator of Ras-like GTPase activity (Roadblock/LC7/MglB family)|nr:roadblock/LC7 domain-containing protein [Candidatus Sulfotelmatobacter sp.]
MPVSNLMLLEADHTRLAQVLDRLRQDANAKIVFLIDKNGQQLAAAGNMDGLDPTSLASLTAGNVAATDGLAKLLGEREFSILFHEGEHDNLHINVVGGKAILVVLFDEHSSLGLVRLRVKKATGELASLLDEIVARSQSGRTAAVGSLAAFGEITDDDIDALFS